MRPIRRGHEDDLRATPSSFLPVPFATGFFNLSREVGAGGVYPNFDHPSAQSQLQGGGDRGGFLGGTTHPPLHRHSPKEAVGAKPGGMQSPRGFIHWGDAARCHPLPGAFRKKEKKQSPVSKPTRVMGAPRVPGELLGCWIRPVCIPAAVAPSRWSGDGFPLPGPHAQHWLHGGGPPTRRVSRDSMVPVGVGGVTMMEGTCRFFSPGDAAGVLSLPFSLLTHVFKPAKMGGDQSVCVGRRSGVGLQHPPPPCPPPDPHVQLNPLQATRESTATPSSSQMKPRTSFPPWILGCPIAVNTTAPPTPPAACPGSKSL